jgi:hypothetical protein
MLATHVYIALARRHRNLEQDVIVCERGLASCHSKGEGHSQPRSSRKL